MQVALSFGPYPCNVEFGKPGPYTSDELGILWLQHAAAFSRPGMLYNHSLVLLLPEVIAIPEDCKLDAWGSVKRFPENSKVQSWPMGPNLVFQQLIWLQYNKRLNGPFLWCEPDCIPVVPDWLDQLDEEYRRAGKPFLGANVEPRIVNHYRIPRHLTGNAIYPDHAYKLAPKIVEARMTAWDVYAAGEILPHAYFSELIQHEYQHKEITTRRELMEILKPKTVLFHSDKYGAIARLLAQVQPQPKGKTLVEAFAAESAAPPAPVPPPEEDFDQMLARVVNHCHFDSEFARKVAYTMVEHKLVNQGHIANYGKMKKARLQTDASPEPAPEPEPAA